MKVKLKMHTLIHCWPEHMIVIIHSCKFTL